MKQNCKKLLKCFSVFLASAFIALFLFSCSMTLPKKLSVQASPEIKAKSGDLNVNLSDFFSVDMLSSMFGEQENMALYDFKTSENDDDLRFLLKFSYEQEIEGLEIDNIDKLVSKNLQEMKFGYNEDGEPDDLVTIPDFNVNIGIDETEIGLSTIAPNLQSQSAKIPFMLSSTLPSPKDFTSKITLDGIKTATFADDTSLNFTFPSLKDVANVTNARVTEIYIKDSRDRKITSNAVPIDLKQGRAVVKLPVGGKTVKNEFEFGVTIAHETNGAMVDTSKTIDIAFENFGVKQVTGVTFEQSISISNPKEPITMGAVQGLKEGEIGEGAINLNLGDLPSGIMVDEDNGGIAFTITQEDDGDYKGFNITGGKFTKATNTEYTLDLSNQKFNTKNVTVSGTINIKAEDATIDLPFKFKPTAQMKIDEIAKVKMTTDILPDKIKNGITESILLRDVYKKGIHGMTFNEIGLKLTLTNTLPMDINLMLNSAFMQMTNKTEKINGKTSTPQEISISNKNSTDVALTEDSALDVNLTMDLGATDGIITIEGVKPGDKYQFYGKAEPIIDLEKVRFQIPDEMQTEITGSFPEDGNDPIDLSMLKNILGDEIKIAGINMYGYVGGGPLEDGKDFGIKGSIGVTYTGEDGNPVEDFVVGGKTEYESITPRTMPKLNIDENGTVIAKLEGTRTSFSDKTVFTKAINAGPKDFGLSYTVKIDNTKEEEVTMAGLKERGTTLYFTILLDFPIALKVPQNEKGYAALDLLELIKSFNNSDASSEESDASETEDIFGRENETVATILNTVLGFVENASVEVNYDNKTGLPLTIAILGGTPAGNKYPVSLLADLKKGTGATSLALSYDDAQYIINHNPFNFDSIGIRIPGSKDEDTVHQIKRSANLKIGVEAKVKTDIDYSLEW